MHPPFMFKEAVITAVVVDVFTGDKQAYNMIIIIRMCYKPFDRVYPYLVYSVTKSLVRARLS